MKKIVNKIYLLSVIAALCFISKANSQVSISGPTCVTTGAVYQYNISAPWDSTSNFQICISGGTISDSASNCISGMSIPVIHVIWDSTAIQGNITISSSKGDTTLPINFTQPLSGGIIDSIIINQFLDSTKLPSNITCSIPTGGSCNPLYSYQWQQSTDNVSWADITSATNAQLSFTSPFKVTTFFRRKVIDTNSAAVSCSGIATVYIMTP